MDLDHNAGATSAFADQILRRLALKAIGMTGADIKDLVSKARRRARLDKRSVIYADLESALKSGKPEISEETLCRLAIHEAGHAVVRSCLGVGSISLITLNGAGGSAYVTGSEQGSEVMIEEKLSDLLVIHLAGRAAEHEFYSGVSIGAGGSPRSDLAQATKLVFDMEMTLGFGDEHPLLYRAVNDPFALLAINSKLAERVSRCVKAADDAARKIVGEQREAVEYLARTLLIQETLEGEALEAAMREGLHRKQLRSGVKRS